MATETPELLPCPFCGGDAVLGYEYEINSVYVNCSRCHCGTGYIDEDADAVKAWNTRAELADLKAAKDKIERYERMIERDYRGHMVRDWAEDLADEDSGEYQHTCHICKEHFFGHKRRFDTCKKCWIEYATKIVVEHNQQKAADDVRDTEAGRR